MTSLKQKTFHGVSWSFIDSLSGSGVSFFIGIILARLLEPSVFGIIGMVTIFFALSRTFVDSGFSTGLIRKVKCTPEEYSTVFLFNLGISIFLYSLLFLMAPQIARFFNEPVLVKITRILGIIIIVDSLAIVQRTILTRAIDFKKQTIISLISSVFSGIIAIYMAYSGFGVWSLVVQILVKNSMTSILLWILSKWRPSLVFSRKAFNELFNFGSKILGTSLITTFNNQIYYFVIGRFFSAASLGFYTRAEQFNAIVTGNITGTLERVFFPVLATIQEDSERLKANFKKTLRTSFFLTFLALSFLAAVAKPLIIILIGEKWIQSVSYLQLLAIASVFFPINILNLNILKIKGRSDLILKLQIIKMVLLAPVLLSAILWGIKAMLVASIITTFFATYINSIYAGRLIKYSFREQLKDISPYFFSIGIISLIMFFISFAPFRHFPMLLIQMVIGSGLFFLIFEKKQFAEYLEIKGLIFSLIKK